MLEPRLAGRLVRAGFWGVATLVFVLAVIPAPPSPPLLGWDKAQHFLAFYVLAILAAAAFPRRSLLAIGLPLSAYGAVIELAQMLPFVHRDGDFWDWVADSLAIAAALAPLLVPRVRAWLRLGQPAD